MSSAVKQEGGFNPYADLRAFYSGIQVEPLHTYDDQLVAATVLGVQMCKLQEEVAEVIEAHELGEDTAHMAEEAIDVGYVAVGINYILGIVGHDNAFATNGEEPSIASLIRLHQGVYEAHLGDDKERIVAELSALAHISFGLVESLGLDPRELWARKHNVNITKYDANLYAELRSKGLSHVEAIDALKASWPERRLLFDQDALPIDISKEHLVV